MSDNIYTHTDGKKYIEVKSPVNLDCEGCAFNVNNNCSVDNNEVEDRCINNDTILKLQTPLDAAEADLAEKGTPIGEALHTQKPTGSSMERKDLVELHKEICGKALELMQKKNADYTGGGGPFANFDSSASFNVHRVQGALIRMMDKLQRVNSFIERGVLSVEDESVEDTIIDLINYPILIAGMIREEKIKAE